MTRRSTEVLRGLGSILLLALLLVGPPLALATLVGWPLPTWVPELSSIELALRSGVSDDVIVKALALIAWIAWLQIAAAIAAETIAVLRGRPARRLPVLPGVQPTIGRIVASIAMMTATMSPAAFAGAVAVPSPAIAAPAPPPAATSTPATPPNVQPGPTRQVDQAAPTPPPTVTVERHDSYWAIAERTLGDGYRWREIRDVNVGHTMNTGHIIQPGSDLVLPGWTLELPPDASTHADAGTAETADVAAAQTSPPSDTDLVVEPGDSFWTLAEQQLTSATGAAPTVADTAPYWQRMVGANEARLVEPGNPSLILPGQHLVAPPVVDAAAPGPPTGTPGESPPVDVATGGPSTPPAPVLQALPDTPTTAEAPALPRSTLDAAPPTTDSRPQASETAPTLGETTGLAPNSPVVEAEAEPHGDHAEAPIVLIGAGMASAALAVGATRAIRRRRRRAAHVSPEARRVVPSEVEQAVHRALVDGADELTLDELRTYLRDLARAVAESGSTARPRIVQLAPDHLEVFLDRPDRQPPPGWTAEGDGAVWIPSGSERTDVELQPICATPLLITLGQPDEGGQLYLDLEADHLVSLVGDEESARNVARAFLAELALTPLAETTEVLVVGEGLGVPEAANLDHVTVVGAWDEIDEDLAAWIEQTHAALVDNDWPNAFAARGHEPYHDALAPVVIVAAEPPPVAVLEHLSQHPLASLAVVAVGLLEGATVIECQPESITLVDLGLVCTPYPMEPEVLDAVIDLVADDEEIDEEGLPIDPVPEDEASQLVIEPEVDEDVAVDEPDYEILVRVLGDIRVEGGAPLAAKQTAVVTYIALHRDVSSERLQDAVWASPSTSSRRKRLANTISECRAAIGRRHLPAASDGRYRLGPGITTDLELFDLRIKRAADQQPDEAAETLLSALELVTGPPFTYRSTDRASFAWVEVENWVSAWEVKIAAVAQRCADLLLDLGRTDDAVHIALHALSILPTHAGLTETLMRAHAANGDRLAVRRVYEEHVTALESLELDDADEATSSLYERLVKPMAG